MKYLLFLALIITTFSAIAQMPTPVKWDVQIHTEGETQWISLDANMEEGWVVYSQNMGDDGPVPTTFTYSSEGDMKTDGVTEELSPMIKKYSELFEMEVKKFKHDAKFKQKITSSGHGIVSVDVNYMTCNGDKCLPPKTETFQVKY